MDRFEISCGCESSLKDPTRLTRSVASSTSALGRCAQNRADHRIGRGKRCQSNPVERCQFASRGAGPEQGELRSRAENPGWRTVPQRPLKTPKRVSTQSIVASDSRKPKKHQIQLAPAKAPLPWSMSVMAILRQLPSDNLATSWFKSSGHLSTAALFRP